MIAKYIAFLSALALFPLSAEITGKWEFSEFGKNKWLEAKVPGEVHTDLLRNRMIEDPFLFNNDSKVQWIGYKDWEYRTRFDVDASTLDKQHVELLFPGLDTYADVYLNEKLVLQADNMFRSWRVDAKKTLKAKDNQLRIHFKSVYRVDLPKYLDAPFKLQAWPNNDQSDIWLSLYARKAGYHYGWDWGARFLTCGVWRKPFIEAWDSNRLLGVHLVTRSLKDNKAQMTATFETESAEAQSDINLSIHTDSGPLASKTVDLAKGMNRIEVGFEVSDPKLWWSNGLGKAHLYQFDCRLDDGREVIQQKIRTGIRTLEVVRENDKAGRSFFIRLNGIDVFMKGANSIPMDNFVNRLTGADYRRLIQSAVDANMNMLRVWGGGIYEDEMFYNLCDEHGILVWQDIMFACGMFPADARYLESVTHEVADNVRRLRNHPSIALWNGNNENEISYFEWGWQRRMSDEADQIYQKNLRKLFYETIPAAILTADTSRYYHPTSPDTGYNGIGHNMGDVHLWTVWKGADVEDYLKSVGRFMSEYGFQAYPDLFTIRKYAGEKDRRLGSPVMLSHQRAKNDETRDPHYGDKMMTRYMDKYFTTPSGFEDFIYMSQFQQAEIVKVAIESHRRNKPFCMGTLYWQINDVWPAASWSSIDYYGRWKALHYYVREAYKEVLVSPYIADENLKVKVVSDRNGEIDAVLDLKTMSMDGAVLFQESIPIKIASNACVDVFGESLNTIFPDSSKEKGFVVASLKEAGNKIASNVFFTSYANKYTYAEPKPQITVQAVDNGFKLRIQSKHLIRGLYLHTDEEADFFESNYINVLPGEPVEVMVHSSSDIAEFEKQLKFNSYNKIWLALEPALASD
jgi:beta-mannosidase